MKFIVTDFDGTLVNSSEKEPSKEFYRTIKSFTSRGNMFAVASGRPYFELEHFSFPIKNDTVFIPFDGAAVIYRNCILYKAPIEKDAARKLCMQAVAEDVSVYCCLKNENKTVTKEDVKNPFLFSGDIFKLVLSNSSNASKIIDAAQSMGLRVCYSDKYFVELCAKGADKGSAVKSVCKKFSLNSADLTVFGDGENDIPLFELTKNVFTPICSKNEFAQFSTAVDSVQKEIIKLCK